MKHRIKNPYFALSQLNKKSGKYTLRILLWIALLVPFLPKPMLAQVMSLDSVIATIDQRNPMLQEYDEKVKALNEYSRGATSWMAPMVGVGTFMTPYPNQTVMHESDKGAWMFSLEQEIPNPGKLKANRKFLESKADVENEGRRIQLNLLRSQAKSYYFQWLVAEKKMRVLQENEEIVALMLKLARIRYPYNQGSLGNIYKTEGRQAEVQNMIEMTQGDIDDKRVRLKALMNLPQQDSLMVDTSTVVDEDFTRIRIDTADLSSRSDISQIDETIRTMRLNQQLQRSQAKPGFRIRFDHMQPIGDMPKQFTAMAMVSIPIAPWSSKMYKAEIKGMEYGIEAMQQKREGILVETKGMVAGMSSQLMRMKTQLKNYESKIIPALRKNYQAVMLAYEENREQLPVVIDAWEALNMSQLEHLNKLGEYYNMIVTYEKELER